MGTDTIASPTTEAELAELVRSGSPVHVFGSGTKRHHGPAATGDPVPVCLRKLSKITAYEPGDLVVTVQAVTKLSELQAELARRNQWLPLDPPYADAR